MSEATPHRRGPEPLTLRCFDLETTGVDVDTCEVVQAAVVHQRQVGHSRERTADSQLFAATNVPPESTAVHRITDRDPDRFAFPVTVIPADAPRFAACVRAMVCSLTADDVVSVSFNGCGYDIPIIARYAAPVLGITREAAEVRLRANHIDVMRLWARARKMGIEAPWVDHEAHRYFDYASVLTSDMFAGGLGAAHGFWIGRGFSDAHDAAVDCRATLAVLNEMLTSGFVTVEQAIEWSNLPLPGDVDFDGKFKWSGDQAVIGFGKHADTPIESIDSGYLTWMLKSDFPASTKQVIRNYLAGEYPQRAYESETA
jgi:hypothetical protein